MSDLTAAQLIPLLTAFRSAELTDLPSGMLEGLDFAAVLLQQLGVGADELPSAETLASLIDKQSESIDAIAGQVDELAASPDASALLQNLTALFQTIASSAAAIEGMTSSEDAVAGTAVPVSSMAADMLSRAAATPSATKAKETSIPPTGTGGLDSPVPRHEIGDGLLPATLPPIAVKTSGNADNEGASSRRLPAVFAAADDRTAKTAGKNPEREMPTIGNIADRAIPTYADATNNNNSAIAPSSAQSETAPSLPSRIEVISVTPATERVDAAPVSSAHAPKTETSFRVDTPIGTRGWDADFSQKLVWMFHREESRAELTLNPPQLGKVEVTISVNGDQTSASFVSASPAVREVLEQALPRLREILADAGITLGQASVNAESTPRDKGENPANARRDGRNRDALAATDTGASANWVRRGSGLIDTFA